MMFSISMNFPASHVWLPEGITIKQDWSCLEVKQEHPKFLSENIGFVWKCCVPLNPMVLLIIIPFLNGYFIGNIPNIFRQTHWFPVKIFPDQSRTPQGKSPPKSPKSPAGSGASSRGTGSSVPFCLGGSKGASLQQANMASWDITYQWALKILQQAMIDYQRIPEANDQYRQLWPSNHANGNVTMKTRDSIRLYHRHFTMKITGNMGMSAHDA